jgi:hypothetical protein
VITGSRLARARRSRARLAGMTAEHLCYRPPACPAPR